jgi:23S rRNA pseudouridine1911/1915/1917 synthase
VVYEDPHLLVVDKPAGLVVHPGRPGERGTLAARLLAAGAEGGEEGRPGIVHRLDRDTSGLLLVARSEEAHRRLSSMIRRRLVDRRYLALVVGRPRSRTGRIEAAIGRDRRDRTRHSLDTATPREAVTWFELRELLPGRALLEVRLETGRTHQIRVHLAAMGHPVLADAIYGAKKGRALPARGPARAFSRQALHASEIELTHPVSGALLRLAAPIPADMSELLCELRKTASSETRS